LNVSHACSFRQFLIGPALEAAGGEVPAIDGCRDGDFFAGGFGERQNHGIGNNDLQFFRTRHSETVFLLYTGKPISQHFEKLSHDRSPVANEGIMPCHWKANPSASESFQVFLGALRKVIRTPGTKCRGARLAPISLMAPFIRLALNSYRVSIEGIPFAMAP